MSVFFPTSVSDIGTNLWTFIIAVANQAAATTTELNAATGVMIQMAIRPGFGIESETATLEDRRLGAFVTYQSHGTTTRSLTDAVLIDRPQTTTGDASRKHIETMAQGVNGFLVNRRGLGAAPENFAAWATTQKYWLVPVTCGPQTPITPADEGGQYELRQVFAVTGALVAGIVA